MWSEKYCGMIGILRTIIGGKGMPRADKGKQEAKVETNTGSTESQSDLINPKKIDAELKIAELVMQDDKTKLARSYEPLFYGGGLLTLGMLGLSASFSNGFKFFDNKLFDSFAKATGAALVGLGSLFLKKGYDDVKASKASQAEAVSILNDEKALFPEYVSGIQEVSNTGTNSLSYDSRKDEFIAIVEQRPDVLSKLRLSSKYLVLYSSNSHGDEYLCGVKVQKPGIVKSNLENTIYVGDDILLFSEDSKSLLKNIFVGYFHDGEHINSTINKLEKLIIYEEAPAWYEKSSELPDFIKKDFWTIGVILDWLKTVSERAYGSNFILKEGFEREYKVRNLPAIMAYMCHLATDNKYIRDSYTIALTTENNLIFKAKDIHITVNLQKMDLYYNYGPQKASPSCS